MSTEAPTINSTAFWVYLIATFLMAMFGAKMIGKAIPSIPLMVAIGFAFSLSFALLPSSRKHSGPEFEDSYLGLCYPFLPLIFSPCFAVISWLLIVGKSPTQPNDFVWAFLGGTMAFVAVQQLYVWSHVRKIGTLK